MHLDLIDQQVWIQNNSTEIHINRKLITRGISSQDIVLGFRFPRVRKKLASILSAEWANCYFFLLD